MPDAVCVTPNLTALRAWARAMPKSAELFASVEKMEERIKELEGKTDSGNEVKSLRQALSEIHNKTPYVLGITLERAAGDVSKNG
jgi:hypothetical protein